MSTSIHDIKQQLKSYKRKYYTNHLLKGSIFFLAAFMSSFLIANFIEYFAELPIIGRTIIFYLLLIIFVYTFVFWIAIPIKKLMQLDKFLTDEEASKQIGQYFKNIDDKLLNTLQLSQSKYSENILLKESINQRTKELNQFDFSNAIKFETNRRYFFRYLSIPLIIMIIILLFHPKIISEPSSRIVQYQNDIQKVSPFTFNYINKKKTSFRNEIIEIECQIEGSTIQPSQVFANINGKRRLLKNTIGNSFTTTILNPQNNLNIRFEVGEFKSELHHIELHDRPELQSFDLSIKFPNYTQLQPQQLHNTGSVQIPEGTSLEWAIKSNNTEEVVFTFDSIVKKASLNKGIYSLSHTAKTTSTYQIALNNDYGANKNTIEYSIDVIKDQYPRIKQQQFEDTVLYNYLLIGGSIADDYGFTRLKIYYKPKNQEKYTLSIIKINTILKSQEFYFEIPIDQYAKGTSIEYFLTISDNDGVNGPKTTKTTVQHYEIPKEELIKEKINQQEEKTNTEFSQSQDKSEKIANQIQQLRNSLKGKKKMEWQDKKDVEKFIEEHNELEKDVQKLAEQLQNEHFQKERFQEPNEELQEKMDHLNRLMEELLDDDTKKLMEELEQLLNESKDIDQVQEKLSQLEQEDNKLEKEIDRALELYKQLKFDQKLDQNISKLEDFAQKQQDLAKKTEEKEKSNKELSKQQQELNKDFDALKKDIQSLHKLNEELKKPKDMDSFDKEQQDISENQQQSSEQLDKNNNKKAGEKQQKAGDQMQEMAQSMKKMQQGMEQEQAQENLEDLKHLLHNLMYLTHSQENLLKSFRKTQQRDPQFVYLSEKQVVLNESSSVVEDSLYALASRVFQIEPYITKELSAMLSYMDQSNEAIKARKKNYAVSKQQYAMTSMNNLALLLDDVLKQMQQQMANKKPGNQMCNKPGSGSKPNLGKMQKQLNQMIQELKNGQKQGRKPSKNIAKMAAQQQQIREGLKQLQKEGDNSKELRKQLKELEQLMKQTEKDLINKNISDNLVQRQKKIKTKLLEAEKASEQQKFDRKRESKVANQLQQKYPPAFDKYIKAKEKQIELIKTIPPNLTPYYKEEVNKYYQRIN